MRQYAPGNYNCRPSHQFSELVIITAGSGLHIIRDERYPIQAGDVFIINDNSPHEYHNMENLSLINVLYDPDDLAMFEWETKELPGYHALFRLEPSYRKRHKFESKLKMNIEDLGQVKAMVDDLDNELSLRKPGFRIMSKSIFMQIVCYLSRNYGKSQEIASLTLLKIGEAITFLEQNYMNDINLDQLAKVAHMSRRNFCRVFQNAMGTPAIEYLIKLRIGHSLQILKNEDITITDTSLRVGFSDSNYFSRQFKKIMGQTPQEYKSKNRIKG